MEGLALGRGSNPRRSADMRFLSQRIGSSPVAAKATRVSTNRGKRLWTDHKRASTGPTSLATSGSPVRASPRGRGVPRSPSPPRRPGRPPWRGSIAFQGEARISSPAAGRSTTRSAMRLMTHLAVGGLMGQDRFQRSPPGRRLARTPRRRRSQQVLLGRACSAVLPPVWLWTWRYSIRPTNPSPRAMPTRLRRARRSAGVSGPGGGSRHEGIVDARGSRTRAIDGWSEHRGITPATRRDSRDKAHPRSRVAGARLRAPVGYDLAREVEATTSARRHSSGARRRAPVIPAALGHGDVPQTPNRSPLPAQSARIDRVHRVGREVHQRGVASPVDRDSDQEGTGCLRPWAFEGQRRPVGRGRRGRAERGDLLRAAAALLDDPSPLSGQRIERDDPLRPVAQRLAGPNKRNSVGEHQGASS